MTTINMQDGTTLECAPEKTFFDILMAHDKGLLKKCVAMKAGESILDLTAAVETAEGVSVVEPVKLDSEDGLEVMRHSTAHVMAEAVKELFPEVKFAIGPTIENGFYYDFDVPEPFTPEDLKSIEKKMTEIIRANHPFSSMVLTRDAALDFFRERKEDYKVEIIEDLTEETVTLYTQSGFTDLCRGPHIPSTGYIKAFKLTGSAGAYWRGDESRKMLQRLYGTAFASKSDLKDHLKRLEEARKRDHRRIGKDLDLYSTSPEIGAGLVLWHPKGAVVRGIIEDFWRDRHRKTGYDIIYSPHVASVDLWKTSGHWDFYKENLFSPMDLEGQEYIVKPMNCPFHIEVYKSRLRSYRDLPIRYAELGTVYRYERSGVLHGLLRVRGFTQDDAHIFMTHAQMEEEIKSVLNFTLYILRSFGFNEFDIYLSTRPDKYVGDLADWARAEAALGGAMESLDLPYTVDPGEGVFYGPKIDIKIKDVLGRSWQCSTLQVDFNLPERFDVTYRDSSGVDARPIMLHRALMGSLERFMGCLVEHYAGAFPLWLAPVQVRVLTVTERNLEYGEQVLSVLKDAGLRADLDDRGEKLGFKIREGEMEKIPYLLVLGDREQEEEKVAPRAKWKGVLDNMSISEFLEMLNKENKPQGGKLQ
ncbi:MAG: threonine--tRNA ligase [Thermodesulfobacteriota bacterium]